MRANDAPELQRRLLQLADALAGKAPSAAGLVVWLDALAECDASDVWAVLVDWPKSHAKMPLPAEVLKAARDVASARRERIAQAERDAERKAADSLARNLSRFQPEGGRMTPAYLEFKRAMAELKRRPKPHPKQWAYDLRDKESRGEFLYPVQRENWRAALRETSRTALETEDEREARLEREAIQSEAGA